MNAAVLNLFPGIRFAAAVFFWLMTLGVLGAEETSRNATNEQPNIVFVIADDCTFRDLGCYGGQAHTPNIDRLAKEGMRFQQCFQAAPMCSPTRHNIYTGLYPVRSGAYPNHTFVRPETKSVCQYLGELGYRVALSGKKHINPKTVFEFEYSGKKNNPDREAIEALFADRSKGGKPFCLFACSNEPHSPWNKGDRSRYPVDKISLPSSYVDTPEQRDAFSRYLAEITYFDSQVGMILSLLKKYKLENETLVMVTSEQGNAFPFAKWTLYDSGLQSAMICRWPEKIEAGTNSKAMIEYVDILPTMIEAAGGRPAEGLDGRSFLGVLRGQTDTHKNLVYGIMTSRGIINAPASYGIRSIRSEQFKLIWNLSADVQFTNACTKSKEFQSWIAKAKSGDADAADKVRRYQQRPEIELYDVKKDRHEWTNLADDPRYSKTRAELLKKLKQWMQAQGDEGQSTEMKATDRLWRNRKRNRKKK